MTKTIDALVEALVEALERLAEYTDELVSDHECRPLENARAALALARAEQVEPIYMYQLSDGSWIEQTKASYEYNLRHSKETATARIFYATPPAPVQAVEPLTAWQPQFEAISHKQETLVREFCAEIAGPFGGVGNPPDPVRLLEMAQALYEAERDDLAAAPPLPKG